MKWRGSSEKSGQKNLRGETRKWTSSSARLEKSKKERIPESRIETKESEEVRNRDHRNRYK